MPKYRVKPTVDFVQLGGKLYKPGEVVEAPKDWADKYPYMLEEVK